MHLQYIKYKLTIYLRHFEGTTFITLLLTKLYCQKMELTAGIVKNLSSIKASKAFYESCLVEEKI